MFCVAWQGQGPVQRADLYHPLPGAGLLAPDRADVAATVHLLAAPRRPKTARYSRSDRDSPATPSALHRTVYPLRSSVHPTDERRPSLANSSDLHSGYSTG